MRASWARSTSASPTMQRVRAFTGLACRVLSFAVAACAGLRVPCLPLLGWLIVNVHCTIWAERVACATSCLRLRRLRRRHSGCGASGRRCDDAQQQHPQTRRLDGLLFPPTVVVRSCNISTYRMRSSAWFSTAATHLFSLLLQLQVLVQAQVQERPQRARRRRDGNTT